MTVRAAPACPRRADTHRHMQMSDFVLDLADNPHPRMLAGARKARANAETSNDARAFWSGYLAAMCDATGETRDAIEAWMDRQ